MSSRALVITSLVVGLFLVAPAAAQSFGSGNLFVASAGADRVYEYDAKGGFVRTYGLGTALSSPQSVAFGPTGLLYVASRGTGSVMVFTPDGFLVSDLAVSGGSAEPSALAFGPDGAIYALDALNLTVVVLNDQGTQLDTVTLPPGDYTQSDLVFGPAGHLFAADAAVGRVVEVDLHGAMVNAIGASTLTAPTGLAFGPNGHLFVGDGSAVFQFESGGSVVAAVDGSPHGLTAARGLSFGPDGHLYVGSTNGVDDVVLELDVSGALVRVLGAANGMAGPAGQAFAPYRFLVKVKGTVARPGQNLSTLREKSAVLSVTPGSRQMMLAVTDDVATFDDLASVFNAGAYVFNGFDAFENDNAHKRLFHGSQIPEGAFGLGVASVAVRLLGQVKNGRFVPKKLSGTLHRSSGIGVYNATVGGGKLLK